MTGVQTCALPIWAAATPRSESATQLDGQTGGSVKLPDRIPVDADPAATTPDPDPGAAVVERGQGPELQAQPDLLGQIGRASCRERV